MLISDFTAVILLEYELIYALIRKKGTQLKVLAEFCEMDKEGFSRALKNQTLKVKTLEKISAFFEVHPGYFFGPDPKGSAVLIEQIAALKKSISEKEKALAERVSQIEDKNEIIRLLKLQINE